MGPVLNVLIEIQAIQATNRFAPGLAGFEPAHWTLAQLYQEVSRICASMRILSPEIQVQQEMAFTIRFGVRLKYLATTLQDRKVF